MILQQLGELLHHVLRRAVLLLPLQVLVRADNLHELHREVILRPRAAVERHGRAHRVRRHRQRLEHKPRGMRVLGVKAEDPAVLVADVLEDVQRPLRGDHLLTLAAVGKVVVLLELLELRGYLHPLQPVLRLGGSGGWADRLRLARIRELAQALLVVLDAHDLRELGILVLRWGRGKGEAGESSAAVGGGDGPMPRCPRWKNSLQRERLVAERRGERRGAARYGGTARGEHRTRVTWIAHRPARRRKTSARALARRDRARDPRREKTYGNQSGRAGRRAKDPARVGVFARTLSIISFDEENPTHRSTLTTFLMNP